MEASFVMGSGRERKIMLLRDRQKTHQHVVNPTKTAVRCCRFSNAFYLSKLLENVIKHENQITMRSYHGYWDPVIYTHHTHTHTLTHTTHSHTLTHYSELSRYIICMYVYMYIERERERERESVCVWYTVGRPIPASLKIKAVGCQMCLNLCYIYL